MRSERREITECTELPNQESIRTLGEKENHKNQGMIEADTIKQAELKGNIRKEFFRRTRNHLEINHCWENLIKGINNRRDPFVWSFGPSLQFITEELIQMDQKTKKLLSMQRCYAQEITNIRHQLKERERIVVSIVDCVDATIQGIEEFTKQPRQITAASNSQYQQKYLKDKQ